jgi:hypothetical protein
MEAQDELEAIALEMFRAKKQVEQATSMAKQHEHLAKEWERLKKVLSSPDVGEEELDQVVESAESMRIRFHLRREIMEAHFELAIAKEHGEQGEVEEIRNHIRELEEGIRENDEVDGEAVDPR